MPGKKRAKTASLLLRGVIMVFESPGGGAGQKSNGRPYEPEPVKGSGMKIMGLASHTPIRARGLPARSPGQKTGRTHLRKRPTVGIMVHGHLGVFSGQES